MIKKWKLSHKGRGSEKGQKSVTNVDEDLSIGCNFLPIALCNRDLIEIENIWNDQFDHFNRLTSPKKLMNGFQPLFFFDALWFFLTNGCKGLKEMGPVQRFCNDMYVALKSVTMGGEGVSKLI